MSGTKTAVAVLAAAACTALGQQIDTDPQPYHIVAAEADSGLIRFEASPQEQVLYSAMVDSPGALWTRAMFGEVELGAHAFLRITSLHDGHQQRLNRVTVEQWQRHTAVFNGEAVFVELVAPSGAAGEARVEITGLWHGEPRFQGESICDGADNRQLSSDPRAGRVWTIGCTAWLIDDCARCLITAGHCGPSSTAVIQFNVPLSTSSGSAVAPPPEHQYAVDPSSIQTNGGGGVGNDYAYFGVFPNANTGLHPADAQGATYSIAPNIPASGEGIRITGYGSTSSPVSPTWNLVQKTHVGPEANSSGTSLGYRPDTTGGNSGSPVIQESTGLAIGVHTHGGCTSTGGNNWGTSLTHPSFQNILANPRGICICTGPDIAVVGTLPSTIPSGGAGVQFSVTQNADPIDFDSIAAFADSGSGFVELDVTALGGDVYAATIPQGACAEEVDFYFYAEDVVGVSTRLPAGTSTFSAVSTDGDVTVVDLDFQTDPGWTVVDTAITTGTWAIGTPNGLNGAPPTDADGSGQAYLTGVIPNHDVDGGPTVLTTTLYDVSSLPAPVVHYSRWVVGDPLLVEIRGASGNWSTLENATSGAGWVARSFEVPSAVAATGAVQLRFTVSDNPNNSTTESGVDAFSITSITCDTCAADLTGEGDVNTNDFFLFLSLYQAQDPRADFAPGGGINTNDFFAYLAAYQAGC